MFHSLRKFMSIDSDNPELLVAQFSALVRQVPMIYFVLCVNSLAISYIFVKFGHLFLTAVLPAAITVFCGTRGVVWWRRRDQIVSPEEAVRVMRSTVRIAGFIAIAVTAWGLALYHIGDDVARAQDGFFLGLTMIACVFGLTHLRPAALLVAAIGIFPYTLSFSSSATASSAP